MTFLLVCLFIAFYFWFSHWLSYTVLKRRVLKRQCWDLNICCGRTDGGGVNADILQHAAVPRFVLVGDIYRLPFGDGEFGSVLCSHTIEHIADPERFFTELRRVGRDVTLVLPPLWDITAALNVFEHNWIFLTWRKEHLRLPRHVRLPLARLVQNWRGQQIKA